jgi:hypothetical protein
MHNAQEIKPDESVQSSTQKVQYLVLMSVSFRSSVPLANVFICIDVHHNLIGLISGPAIGRYPLTVVGIVNGRVIEWKHLSSLSKQSGKHLASAGL